MTNHIVGISSKRHIGTFFRVLTQPCQLLPVYLQMIKKVHLDLMIYDNGFLISHYLFELEFFERVLLVLYKKLDTARGAAEKASFIRPALCLHFGPL